MPTFVRDDGRFRFAAHLLFVSRLTSSLRGSPRVGGKVHEHAVTGFAYQRVGLCVAEPRQIRTLARGHLFRRACMSQPPFTSGRGPKISHFKHGADLVIGKRRHDSKE